MGNTKGGGLCEINHHTGDLEKKDSVVILPREIFL